jgi:hypothetical protein
MTICLSLSFVSPLSNCFGFHGKCDQLGIRPLELVFPWIFYAFAGHLSVGQTLLLWDRVLSYGSLMIVPVLAVAILAFRKKQIVKADTISTLIVCTPPPSITLMSVCMSF